MKRDRIQHIKEVMIEREEAVDEGTEGRIAENLPEQEVSSEFSCFCVESCEHVQLLCM